MLGMLFLGVRLLTLVYVMYRHKGNAENGQLLRSALPEENPLRGFSPSIGVGITK